jgi:hypothetical protein
MAFPDAWQETALISIQKLSGSEIQFAAITSSIDISEGDYPGESIASIAGGRIWKQSAKEDGEITLEMYPIELDTTSGVGLFQQFTGGTFDTSEPLATDVAFTSTDRLRDQFRVIILWTNDPAATTANATTASATDSLRFAAMGCRLTSHKASFTDGELKVTVTFKYPAYSKDGTVKMDRWDSGDQTAVVALADYDDADSWT